MLSSLFVHVPYRQLEATLPFLLAQNLQPEIAFRGPELDDIGPTLVVIGQRFADAGLGITVHAPFYDLNPGALEPLVRKITLRRYRQTLAVARALGARLVVFHPGYDRWKYGGQDHLWLEQNLSFWPPLLEEAAADGLLVALENIFEPTPNLLAQLLASLPAPHFGHCLDIGHWRLFAKTSLADWLAAVGPRLLHLHLHDNRGTADDHLPVGEGDIDFPALFAGLRTLTSSPSMTLEARDRPALLRSLAAVVPFFRGR